MTRATAYQKRYAKARQRRRHTATERLQRDHAQAQRVAKVLEQALDDLGLSEDLVTEIEGRLHSQAIDTYMFTQLGCDLTGKKIVVVKSAQNFYASYAQLARRVIYVTAPGSVTQDLKSLPFRKIKRPKWPL